MEIPSRQPPLAAIKDTHWNPIVASTLGVVFTNGALSLHVLNEACTDYDTTTLPTAEHINCMSWSPKGKQLVAGRSDGRLTQFKPDLKEAKTVAPPPGSSSGLTYLSVLWVSTYQFLVAFKDTSDPDSRPGLCLVTSSKSGETSYVNYDDICYSTGDGVRSPNFLMFQVWPLTQFFLFPFCK